MVNLGFGQQNYGADHRRRHPDRRAGAAHRAGARRWCPGCSTPGSAAAAVPRGAVALGGRSPNRPRPAYRSDRSAGNGRTTRSTDRLRATRPAGLHGRRGRPPARHAWRPDRPRDTEGGASMRTRIRFIAPTRLSRVASSTAACGESGSSGTGGQRQRAVAGVRRRLRARRRRPARRPRGRQASAERRQRHPGGQRGRRRGEPGAAAGAERGLGEADHRGPDRHERGRRRRAARAPSDVAAAWVEDSGVTDGLRAGQRRRSSSARPTSPSRRCWPTSTPTCSRRPASTPRCRGRQPGAVPAGAEDGAEIQAFPEYLATVTEFIDGDDGRTPVGQRRRRQETLAALQPLAEAVGLVFGDPAEAADQNAFAVTTGRSPTSSSVTTLSDLAKACGDGSLILGGPAECPTRPFCQPGLEETYGLKFASFQRVRRRRPADQGRHPAGRGLDRAGLQLRRRARPK